LKGASSIRIFLDDHNKWLGICSSRLALVADFVKETLQSSLSLLAVSVKPFSCKIPFSVAQDCSDSISLLVEEEEAKVVVELVAAVVTVFDDDNDVDVDENDDDDWKPCRRE
jgi:hypothetical protein